MKKVFSHVRTDGITERWWKLEGFEHLTFVVLTDSKASELSAHDDFTAGQRLIGNGAMKETIEQLTELEVNGFIDGISLAPECFC